MSHRKFIKMTIKNLEKYNLTGRGGASFPVWLKWNEVRSARSEKKYIICNAAEGEPAVFKDGYILENYPDEVINGIKIALKTITNSSAVIYLRKDYYKKFKIKLKQLIGKSPIELRKKTGGYLCGEETTILESLEGEREEPRNKPPYPSESGLFGYPTLINNVETFFCVSKIAKGDYRNTRFYSISGDVINPGVYELPENWSIKKILTKTDNFPELNFFVQINGAGGEIFSNKELSKTVSGSGAILVYNFKKTKPINLINRWINFFYNENCGKCVPCREGILRLKEMVAEKKPNFDTINDILFALKETSYCALGRSVPIPIESLIKKIWTI